MDGFVDLEKDGVYINRSTFYNIAEGGASSNPCSLTFGGPAPWSEIEVRNIADYYVTVASDVVVYLAFHSYGQYLLFPFGTSVEAVENYDDLMTIGNAAGDALRQRFGTVYRVGNSQEVLCKYPCRKIDYFENKFSISSFSRRNIRNQC
jgi:hypothetical protein